MIKKVFFTLSLAAISYWFLFDFIRLIQYDNESYISGARLLFSLPAGANEMGRITKPVFLFLPGLMESLLGIHPQYTIILQNIIFFYCNGFLFYAILLQVFKDKTAAYYGMIAYISCQPFAVFSLLLMADGAGWFFELLLIYLCMHGLAQKKSYLFFAGLAVVACIGMYTKESTIAAIVFCVLAIGLHSIPFQLLRNKVSCTLLSTVSKSFPFSRQLLLKEKVYKLLVFLLSFLFLFVVVQLLLYWKYDFSILDVLYKTREERDFSYYYNLKNSRQVYRILDLYWIFFGFGLYVWYKKKNVFENNTSWLYSSLITVLLILLILPLGWPYILDRVLFMVAPFAIMIATYGIMFFKRAAPILLVTAAVTNVLTQFLIYKYNVNNLLYIVFCVYLLLLILLFLWEKKHQSLLT